MKYDLSKKPNRFAERTLAAFSKALLGKLEEKPFEKITVNELCAECNYPRATFYNYFDDIYDLLNYCLFSASKEIMTTDYLSAEPSERIYVIFGKIYDYLDEKRERIKKILAENTCDGALISACNIFVKHSVAEIMSDCSCSQNYPFPYQLAAEHYANTLLLVIEWCFMRDKLRSKRDAEKCLRYLLKNV